MTKKFLPAICAAALSIAPLGAAWSQSLGGQGVGGAGGGDVQISGIAPSACVLSAPVQTAISNATLVAGPQSAEIRLTQLVDPLTAVANPASIDMAFPITCNSAHRVMVRTEQGGLVLAIPAPPPGPGIANRLSYQVSAVWAGQEVTGSSDTLTPVDIATANGAAGIFALSIQIPGGGDPLVAGPYADSVVVELQPAN